ncbi:hypothetical protein [Devosia sp. MC521]|uniref:hypothetical protein n=1 Tax=Devosia sp. MC521 TaxID=2759954 RepID=UPI0015FBC1F9|nr:hypothetical protein [Devosia sp. MC521]MBJ6988868.1 hypothetical protein [Devosia sp. MC521]QMW63680.1 hypothetical protein H4N61_04970 [Devosia sp. MC521]
MTVSKMAGLVVKQEKAVKQAKIYFASKHNRLNHFASVDYLVTTTRLLARLTAKPLSMPIAHCARPSPASAGRTKSLSAAQCSMSAYCIPPRRSAL